MVGAIITVAIVLCATIIGCVVLVTQSKIKSFEMQLDAERLRHENQIQIINLQHSLEKSKLEDVKKSAPKTAGSVDTAAFFDLLNNVDSLWEDTVNDTTRDN